MNWLARLRVYAAHGDKATAAINVVAVVIASNGPFYPIYVLAVVGWDQAGAWLTMLATPFFAAVPLIARRHPAAGRAALPLIGVINTIWCTVLLGSGSAVSLFMLPCIVLTALLYRSEERRRMLLLLGLAIGGMIGLIEFAPAGLMTLHPDQEAALARTNTVSVAALMGFLALTLGGCLRPSSRR